MPGEGATSQTTSLIAFPQCLLRLSIWMTLRIVDAYEIIYIYKPDIGLAVRVFANGPGDLGSIPGRVIPKTQKMVLDASLLNTQHYKVRIKGKVEQSRERVVPSPTPWCCSYRKGSLRVTLDYGRQLYLLIYIYIYYFIHKILQTKKAVMPTKIMFRWWLSSQASFQNQNIISPNWKPMSSILWYFQTW